MPMKVILLFTFFLKDPECFSMSESFSDYWGSHPKNSQLFVKIRAIFQKQVVQGSWLGWREPRSRTQVGMIHFLLSIKNMSDDGFGTRAVSYGISCWKFQLLPYPVLYPMTYPLWCSTITAALQTFDKRQFFWFLGVKLAVVSSLSVQADLPLPPPQLRVSVLFYHFLHLTKGLPYSMGNSNCWTFEAQV